MIQTKLKSHNQDILKKTIQQIITIFKELKIEYKVQWGKTKNQRITVLKSPHVHKKSRDQFEYRQYSCTILYDNKNTEIVNKINKELTKGYVGLRAYSKKRT